MVYPDATHDKNCNKLDPINLIFTNSKLWDVLSFLQQNWNLKALGDTQYLNLSSEKKQMDAQLDQGHFVTDRWHVRIWELNNECVASAHYETFYLYTHRVHHFEGAERKIADQFRLSKPWTVYDHKHDLKNPEYERYNDGFATEVRRQ